MSIKRFKKKIEQTTSLINPYIRTDAFYLFKGGFWVSSEFILGSLLSLALSIVFANFLSREVYGTYKYITSITSSLGFLTLTGMNIAVTQAVANGQDSILKFAVKKQVRWNSLLTLALLAVAIYYFVNNNHIFGSAFAILSITVPLTAAFNTYGAFLAGKKEFRRAAIFSTLSHAIYITAMILASVFGGNLIYIFIAYGISTLLPQIIFYYLTIKKYKLTEIHSIERKNALDSYAKKLSVLNILSTLAQHIDQIIAFQFFGPAVLASFSIASAVPDRLKGLMKSMLGILIPKLSAKSEASLRKTYYLRIFQMTLLGLGFSAISFLLLPYFFAMFFKQYPESVFYAQLISLNFIFLFPQSYGGIYFQSQKLIKYIYASSMVTNLIRLGVYAAVAYFYGIMGLIIAKIIGNILGLIINISLFEIHKRYNSL